MDLNSFIDPFASKFICIEHKSVEVVARGSIGKDHFEEPFEEWIVKVSLEVIYEEYKYEEYKGEHPNEK